MKISLNWLKDYVDYKVAPEKLNHKLTMAGLEVEGVSSYKGDKVFELEITPNRPDCLNMVGVAREVSAILNKSLKAPKVQKFSQPKSRADITIEDKKDCARYIGTVIENVKVKSFPSVIKKKIETIGVRGVNNVVDITNFCLMEMGQPLHAFDLDKLNGRKIVVRRAKKGEKIIAIDGVQYKLNPSILVIADAKKPVAIAGIMGGKDTQVTSKTKNILLESAYFDPVLIRRGARQLGFSSDSSYRFERGVDINAVEEGSQRAVNLILKEAQGNIVAHHDEFPSKQKNKKASINTSINEINNLLGANISISQATTILKKLGFSVSVNRKALKVTPPSFRGDVNQKEDVVEEISRVIGYDNLPESVPNVQVLNIKESDQQKIKESVRNFLTSLGYNEIITYTMTNEAQLKKTNYKLTNTELRIQNPITQDQEFMRPDLLNTILPVVLSNINRGQKDLKFFEVGKVYNTKGEEKQVLGVLGTGINADNWRQQKKTRIGYFEIKGAIEGVLGFLNVSNFSIRKEPDKQFETETSATILSKNKKVGKIGRIDENIIESWDIKQEDIYYAELDLEWVFANTKFKKKFNTISEYPAIVRDISLAIKKEISFQQVKEVIAKEDAQNLHSVDLVEEYLGDKLPKEHKSITISLTYQSLTKTLRDEEVSEVHNKVCQALINQLGATQR